MYWLLRDPDFVGQRTARVTYKYRLVLQGDDIVAADWVGPGPGAIFRPTGKHPSENDRVLDACVREIIGRGNETVLIRSLADYRPWPCT